MLEIHLRMFQNPWGHTVPNEMLIAIFERVASLRAEHVEKHFGTKRYDSNSLGMAFLNRRRRTGSLAVRRCWRPSPSVPRARTSSPTPSPRRSTTATTVNRPALASTST